MELYQNLCRLRRRTLSPPPPAPQLEIWPNYRPPLVGHLRTSALYCTSSALSPEETPEFPRNFTESTIVGYANSKSIAANTFSLGTSPFTTIGSDVVKIQDMLVPNGVTAPTFSQRTKALQLQVWNGTDYTMYYYVSDAYIESTDEEVTGWADKGGDFTLATIAPGTGYWYRYPEGASTFTLPGQVPEAATITKNVSGAFNLYGNPYPVALNLEKVVPSVAAPTFSQRTKALQLQVWNGTDYTMYYYVSDAYIESTDDEVTGWADKGGDYVGQTSADVSYGFWVRSQGGEAGTITFSL